MRGVDLPSLADFLDRPPWMADAACAEHPREWWFPTKGQNVDAARSVCRRCLVREECLDYALADPELAGVWAGTSERERRRLRLERAA